MNTDHNPSWRTDFRSLLDGILNLLIPPSVDGRKPGAGDLGIADYLEKVAATDTTVDHLMQRGLMRAEMLLAESGALFSTLEHDAKVALVAQLEKEEPGFFEVLLRHTYMGYYSRPDVRGLFGLSEQPTQPNGYHMPAEPVSFVSDLTAPVRRRGKAYREC